MNTVEKATRAFLKSRYLNGGNEDDDGWDDLPPTAQAEYLVAMRSALLAIREPTEQMIEAAWADATAEDAAGVWRAMIDAAL